MKWSSNKLDLTSLRVHSQLSKARPRRGEKQAKDSAAERHGLQDKQGVSEAGQAIGQRAIQEVGAQVSAAAAKRTAAKANQPWQTHTSVFRLGLHKAAALVLLGACVSACVNAGVCVSVHA